MLLLRMHRAGSSSGRFVPLVFPLVRYSLPLRAFADLAESFASLALNFDTGERYLSVPGFVKTNA